MAACECLPACIFFNDKMKNQPGMTQIYKKQYCLGGGKDDCARHMVKEALGADKVPQDLYPNQVEKARALIA